MGGTHHLTAVDRCHGPRAAIGCLRATGRSLSPTAIIATKPRSPTAMNAGTGYGHDPDAPWEFVLALLAAVEDPGVIVRPTHRVLIDGRNWLTASGSAAAPAVVRCAAPRTWRRRSRMRGSSAASCSRTTTESGTSAPGQEIRTRRSCRALVVRPGGPSASRRWKRSSRACSALALNRQSGACLPAIDEADAAGQVRDGRCPGGVLAARAEPGSVARRGRGGRSACRQNRPGSNQKHRPDSSSTI